MKKCFPLILVLSFLGLTVSCDTSSSNAVSSSTVMLKGGVPAKFHRSSQKTASVDFAPDTDASLMQFKVFKMAVSLSADCSSPITVFNTPPECSGISWPPRHSVKVR